MKSQIKDSKSQNGLLAEVDYCITKIASMHSLKRSQRIDPAADFCLFCVGEDLPDKKGGDSMTSVLYEQVGGCYEKTL